MFSTKAIAERTLDPGLRLYAVGDVHGRLDLVDDLLGRIRADDRARGPAETLVVFLGDLIDRGPDSAGVVTRLMAGLDWARLVCLKGNHEAALIDALDGDPDAARMWLAHGGRAALASWGVPEALLSGDDDEAAIAAARAHIPAAHLAWIAAMPMSVRIGDYYLVHAGVRPAVPLDAQRTHDQLWIRKDFLGSLREHGALVVHGHTVSVDIDERPNRLGIDTGAYRSGRLSAVGLEGGDRWFLATGDMDG